MVLDGLIMEQVAGRALSAKWAPPGSQAQPYRRRSQRPEMMLATLVAALHLFVLAGRLGGRVGGRVTLRSNSEWVWQAPTDGPATNEPAREKTPSNPQRSYSAGQLALDTGVAVVALAAWLRTVRMNGSRSQ